MTYNPPPPEQQPGAGQGWQGSDQSGWQAQPGWQGQSGQEQYQMQPQPEMQQWQPQPYGAQGYGGQGYAGQPMQQSVAPKSPAVSVLISVFIPGLGSIINGNTATGVTILVLDIIAAFFSLFLIGIPFAIGIWIWGLVDAYTSAQKWNTAHGIIS